MKKKLAIFVIGTLLCLCMLGQYAFAAEIEDLATIDSIEYEDAVELLNEMINSGKDELQQESAEVYQDDSLENIEEEQEIIIMPLAAGDDDTGDDEDSEEHTLYAYAVGFTDQDMMSLDVEVAYGEATQLQVEVESDEPENVSIQWLDSNRAPIIGETGKSFVTGSITRNTIYYCLVEDIYDHAVEVQFVLYVDNGFMAYASASEEQLDYHTFYIQSNDIPELQVTVIANNPDGITYKWFDEEWGLIEGAETASYTPTEITHQSTFICSVTDVYGNENQVWFYINIENHLNAYASDSEGKEQLYTIDVDYGGKVYLAVSVEADNMDGISYTWFDENWSEIEDVTLEYYESDPIEYDTTFYCQVKDQYGNIEYIEFHAVVRNNFYAYALASGEDKESEYSILVNPGELPELAVGWEADISDDVTCQWYDEDGMDLEDETNATYTPASIPVNTSYVCRVTDCYGTSRDVTFSIIVNNHLAAYATASGDEKSSEYTLEAASGEDATLQVSVEADNKDGLSYEWLDQDAEEIDGAESDTYVAEGVTEEGQYICNVTDRYGNMESVIFLLKIKNQGMPGDFNGDGVVDDFDLYRLYRYLNGKNVEMKVTGDVNNDGVIDDFDLYRLFRYLSGKNVKLY